MPARTTQSIPQSHTDEASQQNNTSLIAPTEQRATVQYERQINTKRPRYQWAQYGSLTHDSLAHAGETQYSSTIKHETAPCSTGSL